MKGTNSVPSYHYLFNRVHSCSLRADTERHAILSLREKSRLFGMGRRPLHAWIIVNSKGAQKTAFYLAFPLARPPPPFRGRAWSTRGCACMIPGIRRGNECFAE